MGSSSGQTQYAPTGYAQASGPGLYAPNVLAIDQSALGGRGDLYDEEGYFE
jgi:hypothetical protein